ncbi:MAG: T9SS type A sorting domain-containing protein [Bacteroidota bacterium]
MRAFKYCGKIAAAAFFIVSCFSDSAAQTERRIPVGVQPSSILLKGNDLHVFCSGSDKNFNGTFETGDVAASWWILDATTFAVKSSVTFPDAFLAPPPLRPGFSSTSVYLYMNGKINKYSLFTQQLTSENIVTIPASAGLVSAIGVAEIGVGDILNIVTRPTFTGPGFVYSHLVGIQDLGTPRTVGINPQQFWLSADLSTSLLLNEGVGGQNNSTLQIAKTVDTTTTETTINIGDTGNYFLVQRDSAFVVMTGSHTVQIVDLLKMSVVKTIPTGTTGFDGPRECTINGDTIFVTTYNSDIRAFSITSGTLLKTLPTSGKVDPIVMSQGNIVAGVSQKKGTYDADSALAVFGLPPLVSVGNDAVTLVPAEISPNPVNDNATISAKFSGEITSANIELFNTAGISVGTFTKELLNGELRFAISQSALKLSQGQYMARISAGKNLAIVPFVVVK